MKNFISLLMVASTLSLTACGVSDSSGSNNGSEPFGFAKYGQCEVVNNRVLVPVTFGCKMTNPALNSGKIFALECKRQLSRKETYKLEVLGFKSDNIASVVADIDKSGNGSVLKYACSK